MSTAHHAIAPDDPVFSATLSPHRSLGQGGFVTLMIIVAVLCLIPGLVFLSMGAWPVFGFLGLDVLLVWLAFRLNFRAARAVEIVELTSDALTVRHVTPGGREEVQRIDPYWARLQVKETEDGIESISVSARGQSIVIGRFLPPDEKETFAKAFSRALNRVSRLA